jgi:tellurite resistance protein TerC
VGIGTPALWIGFIVFVLAMLALDLGVFNRKAHVVSWREASVWSGVWIGLALAFAAAVYVWQGPDVGLQFLTSYFIEKSLSVDNIFVFVLIFSAFAVPEIYRHRVLFWGVLGALVMRGALIGLGTILIEHVAWILYVFGAFLVITGVRMARPGRHEPQPQHNPLVRVAERLIPVTKSFAGGRFLLRRDNQRYATPLLITLVAVETSDLLFALDSIPAIFAITLDPFIVFTSNVFAILGLRSLYFLLAGAVTRFRYLHYALAAILVLVGVKMLLADVYHLPIALSLGLIAAFLAVAIVASLLQARRRDDPTAQRPAQPRPVAAPPRASGIRQRRSG